MSTTSTIWKRIALALVLTLILALVSVLGIGGWVVTRAYAQGPWGSPGGYGMMSGNGFQGCGGYGMIGSWGGAYPEGAVTLTMDQVQAVVEQYAKSWNNDDLAVAEVMEFSNHFYAIVHEEGTGIGAFEVLVDKVTGAVYPEPGPNMMWNLKYGMMGGYGMGMMGGGRGYGGMMDGTTAPVSSLDMPIGEARAIELAQKYLDATRPGAMADEEADAFYGYYTLHVLADGQVSGMLSVNGYSGQVWYHTWHGTFVNMAGH